MSGQPAGTSAPAYGAGADSTFFSLPTVNTAPAIPYNPNAPKFFFPTPAPTPAVAPPGIHPVPAPRPYYPSMDPTNQGAPHPKAQ